MPLYLVFVLLFVAALAGGLYWLTGRYAALYGLPGASRKGRVLRLLLSAAFVPLCWRWRTAAVLLLYFLAIFLLFELFALVCRLIWKKREKGRAYARLRRVYRTGLLPLLAAALYLGWGAWNMAHYTVTEYTLSSPKLTRDYTIALITDTHFGTVQDPALLEQAAKELSALPLDAVILGGDIVEEETGAAAMREAFRLLGGIPSTLGTYYVYGNHDRQPYTGSPTYSEGQLADAIRANGITILQDRWVALTDELILAGREDVSAPGGRLPAATLLRGVDPGAFLLVADHQPTDGGQLAELGVDLALSGHTHAGQLFPIGWFTVFAGKPNYGLYEEAGLRTVVSSGFTGWGFPLRTQGRCEYVLLHLTPGP